MRTDGPFLNVAVLCERVLREQDGVLSLVRIVDRWIRTAAGPGASEAELPPVRVNGQIVLLFKAGEAQGHMDVTISLEAPSGLIVGPTQRLSVLFEGQDRGAAVVADVGLDLQEAGLYWFRIKLDDLPLTSIPLRIVDQRLSSS